jgi:large conductance mechanosensitive channel
LVIAFVLFLIVKGMNAASKKKEETPAAPPADIQLLTEIRDLLKNK